MIRAYTSDEAAQFILGFGGLPVEGGPITKSGFLGMGGAAIRTLADFVRYKYPPWGVIVHPGYRTDILVSVDAQGDLHVIDVSKESIAVEVAKAPMESPYLASIITERVGEILQSSGSLARKVGYTTADALARLSGSIEQAIPDPKAGFDKLIMYGGIALIVFVVMSARKS